jgi:hypothetical protein
MREALDVARAAIDSGRALTRLDEFARLSRGEEL